MTRPQPQPKSSSARRSSNGRALRALAARIDSAASLPLRRNHSTSAVPATLTISGRGGTGSPSAGSARSPPPAPVEYCAPGESYADVASRVSPDVIVEDDCESIGGTNEMTYPALPERARERIASVVVREFEGIDHLPDDPALLVRR